MRLAILGKLTCLNALTIVLTIVIISLISWYNNSSYIFSRLNSRFPTLAVLKSQQLDQYLLYTINSVQSIVSRVSLRNATVMFLRGHSIAPSLDTVEEDLRNGANTTLDLLSVRILTRNLETTQWQTLFQYTPDTAEANYYAPKVYDTLQYPPVAGITNPFTISGKKYVFVLSAPMTNNDQDNSSYVQIIFDATRLLTLLRQVTNSAEADTEYILVSQIDAHSFQVLLPPLYHPEYAGQNYSINSDASIEALFSTPKPPTAAANGNTVYDSGIVYDFHNFDGHRVTAGYARLVKGSVSGWGLVVQAPQNQVEQPLHRLRLILIVSAFSCLVIMLLILMPIVWYCTKPVRALRTVTGATHEAPIDIQGLSCSKHRKLLGCIPTYLLHDEVTDIKESFIGLAQSLNEQYAGLDEKVSQRTIELQAAQREAIASNVAKSAFLANMSHEIRSPLQSVIALADIGMLEDQDVSDEVKQTLATIQESGNHLLFLISDILDFSKIEAGHLALEERMFALGQGLINQLRISFRPKADEIGLRFDIITEPPELYQYRVCGDKHRLYQILSNLLSNAIKFTISGFVVFRVSYTPPDRFQFAITDTGCGIPPTVLSKLFQPFTQADSSYSRKYGGTGLGLAVSKCLAELMGGSIAVVSQADKGSTFTLHVPLQITTEPLGGQPISTTPISQLSMSSHISNLSQESQMSSSHSIRNVLVADDNPINRQVLSKMLNKCGIHQITTAVNGQEALNIGQKRVFDLILMDVAMPQMSGMDATRMLRESNYEGMIVALTAHIGAEEHDKALESGVDHVLTKPITLKELKAFLYAIGS